VSARSRTTTLFSGYTVLSTAADGAVEGGEHGLYYRDARLLSAYRLTVDGKPPELVSAVQTESNTWDGMLRVAREGGNPEGPALPQDALELHVHRAVGPGLVETIRVRNRSAIACRAEFRIDVDADFADIAEVGRKRQQEGTISRDIDGPRRRLQIRYRVDAGKRSDERGLLVDVLESSSPAAIEPTGIAFDVDLAAGGDWAATIRLSPRDGRAWRERSVGGLDGRARQRAEWRRRRVAIDCAERLRAPFERAGDDLFDLRNWELEAEILGRSDGAGWILNAGIPMFTGVFGRDVVTAGWQSAMLGPRALAGALDAVAATQADQDDAWRDAEPGKLIHEQRSGPLANLGLSPRDAYYGSQTTPAMFVLALSELWHWTGNDEYLWRHLGVARRAMDWAYRLGDLDGDGFLEYRTRSPLGLRNQGWKDSDEAIRHTDGGIVEGPVATVEEQAFHVLALERLAEVLIATGYEGEADIHLRRAKELRRRFHEAYWMAEDGFYAIALDGRKERVRSIASNPGHALGTGIVPRDVAETVADRLFASDLFSGWGVRSLSENHPSYNPFAYHLGCVWPVEQATFALGLKRYGLDRHLDQLVEAMFDAAFDSPNGRLPEALTGHGRNAVPAPVPYPAANVPQAWSSSALIQLVQVMLGLYPFAPLRILAVVRPRLPVWAQDLTVRGLRVGDAVVDLRFRRRSDGSASWRVLRRRGRLIVVGAGPPDDVGNASVLERLQLAVLARAPGRLARAARIAIGQA
jgi:glycogen debranching enzyme